MTEEQGMFEWLPKGDIDVSLLFRALDSMGDGIVVTDAQERIVAVNDAIVRTTGYTRDELMGANFRILQGRDTQRDAVKALRDALDRGDRYVGEFVNYRKDGSAFWNGISVAPVMKAGRLTHWVSMQRDITDFVAKRTAIEREHSTTTMMLSVARTLSEPSGGRNVTQVIADAVPAVWGVDRSSFVLWDEVGERFVIASMSGWDGVLAEQLMNWEGTRSESTDLTRIMDSGQPALVTRASSQWARSVMEDFDVDAMAVVPVKIADRFLGIIAGYWSLSPAPRILDDTLIDRMTGLAGLAGVALDQARLQQAIEWSTSHDPVTGLPNRRMLEEHVTEQLTALAEHGGDDVVVLACDVDRFTAISDSYPTAVVDSMLREIAARLVSTIGEDGFVARLGRDDFMVAMRARPEDAEALVSRLLDAFLAPFSVGDDTVHAGLSIGGAASADVAPSPHEPVETFGPTAGQRLISLALADLNARRIAEGARQNAANPEDAGLDSDLRSAVRNGEIEVYYQPQVRLDDGALVGVEALVRWNHPRLGQISPVRFIPLAEYNGSIRDIGLFVFETACADAARWAASGHPLEMSVNVAVHQLEDPTFSDRVVRTASTHGLPNERLTLEVTETRLVSDRSVPQAQLHRLRELGFVVSIDDFGTGFSSLTQLSNLPVGELKIDRSFVSGVTAADRSIVAGLIGFARGLGLRVVAEGVEDAEQYEVLRKLGCDRAQGYHLARPMPAEQFEREWLS
ncbi:EAL domain-containing protein [Salinibacterium sp. GXW1014]|uniref:sensor domain-containing protein n=1 Tax=Salinibacterium sp. GXW1014 TaxID=3377838 RepID=UPI00383AEFB9